MAGFILECMAGFVGIRTREPVLRRRRSIASHEMKGVDAAYAVYHLIEVPALRGLLGNATRNPFLKPTAAKLPENMRELNSSKVSHQVRKTRVRICPRLLAG